MVFIIFVCIVNVLENIKIYLILGEIIFIDYRNILVNKFFIIIVLLENWLVVIDDNFVEDEY